MTRARVAIMFAAVALTAALIIVLSAPIRAAIGNRALVALAVFAFAAVNLALAAWPWRRKADAGE